MVPVGESGSGTAIIVHGTLQTSCLESQIITTDSNSFTFSLNLVPSVNYKF